MALFFVAFALPIPWIVLHTLGFHGAPLLIALLTGVSILGAAFLLSWAAELFQMDVSQALALALLALIAILPEYAVDAVFALEAGRDPAIALKGYAVANMTGSNRLLIGLGWTSIVFFAWWHHRAKAVLLERSQALELVILLAASLYALTIPFKDELSLLDTAILVPLYGLYAWMASRAPAEEPDLTGPPEVISARAGTGQRRAITALMFLFAAFAIFISAEPFAHSLVDTGIQFGIDEFLLVQWLAPLASEAPEFIVALLFVARRNAAAGMRTLVSSEVNQWTLLVATLPIVYSIGAGHLGGMPLVPRQETEIWLTAAQSVFAILVVAEFAMTRWEAATVFLPFLLQLVLPTEIEGVSVRLVFTIGYAAAACLLLLSRSRRGAIRLWPRYIQESIAANPPEEVRETAADLESGVRR